MPIIHLDSSIEQFQTDFSLISSGKIRIYELPFRESFAQEDSLIYDSIKYEYFIFQTNESEGFLIRNFDSDFERKKHVDSVLISRAYYKTDFESVIGFPKGRFNKVQKKKKDFEISFKNQTIEVDSIKAYFNDGFKRLNLSLSKKLDEVSKSKLYKIEWYLNPKNYRQQQFVQTIEIKSVPIDNLEKTSKLIIRYKDYLLNKTK